MANYVANSDWPQDPNCHPGTLWLCVADPAVVLNVVIVRQHGHLVENWRRPVGSQKFIMPWQDACGIFNDMLSNRKQWISSEGHKPKAKVGYCKTLSVVF